MKIQSIFSKERMTTQIATLLSVVTVFLAYYFLRDGLEAFAVDNKPAAGTATTASSNASIPSVSVGDSGLTITGGGFNTASGGAWTQILTKYRGFIVGISGIAAVTMVGVFIFHFVKLAGSATNPNARSAALTGLLWSGVAAAGLGSVSLIVGLFYNAV